MNWPGGTTWGYDERMTLTLKDMPKFPERPTPSFVFSELSKTNPTATTREIMRQQDAKNDDK